MIRDLPSEMPKWSALLTAKAQLYYLLTAMTEAEEKKESIQQLMERLIHENPNLQDIKLQIKALTYRAEHLTYHALTVDSEHYLQVYGLAHHPEQHFNYINQLLHTRTTEFLDRISDKQIQVKSTVPPPPPPPPEVPPQIVDEVELVLSNLDLPLSLFKRKDHYWSQDNPKTQQVKQYIKQLHEEDRKWKGELKKKRQEILNQKSQSYHKGNEEAVKLQQKAKEEEKARMLKKIQFYRSQSETRKKAIQQSLEFVKQQGRPLFQKMEEEFKNKVELPGLEERKRKLSEVRSLKKSVDLVEIQQHREKHDKIMQQHEGVKIFNEAVKVSFKSSFHQSLEKSRTEEFSNQSRYQTLCDKKIEYSRVVKEHFKPKIDLEKANELQERIELMNKRFTRAKRNKMPDNDDDDEEDQQEEEEEPEPQPEEEEEQEDDEEDQEDQEPKQKDDQYQPTQEQRYKMGLRFLEEARKRRKKIEAKAQPSMEDSKTRVLTAAQALETQASAVEQHGSTSNQINRAIKYRNYLHQMSKANKTIDHIDTSRVKNQFTAEMKLKRPIKVEEVENKIRSIEEKARYEEQLLKFERRKKAETLQKKQELDNVILDTIKARLALLKN